MTLWLTAGSFIAAMLLGWAMNVAALIPWKHSAGAHWTERARLLYPARVASLLNIWLLSASGALGSALISDAAGGWLLCGAAAWLGALLSRYFMDRRIWPGLTLNEWLGPILIFGMLGRFLLVLIVLAAVVMPPHFSLAIWALFLPALLLIGAAFSGLTLRFLRWLGAVRPAPDAVVQIARRAAGRAGTELRAVFVSKGRVAFGLALVLQKVMLFSESLLTQLSADELAGVCTHEAAHFTESRIVLAGRIAGFFALVPIVLIKPVYFEFGAVTALGLVGASVILVTLVKQIARSMEKRADSVAVERALDPAAYARSLEKVHQLNAMPAVMPRRSGMVHPDLYDRMLAAGVTPAYERPKPPARMAWPSVVLCMLLGGLIGLKISPGLPQQGPERSQIMEDPQLCLELRRVTPVNWPEPKADFATNRSNTNTPEH